MAKRKDIHCPSQITPADYDFVGIWVSRWNDEPTQEGAGPVAEVQIGRERIFQHMRQTGGTWSDHEHGGTCFVCGAHAIYLAVFHHRPTNVYIRTGQDCAGKMHTGLEEAFERAKKGLAGKGKVFKALKDEDLLPAWMIYRCVREREALALSWGIGADTPLPILADAAEDRGAPEATTLRTLVAGVPEEEGTIADVVCRSFPYGRPTDGQMHLLRMKLERIASRPERERQAAERKAARDAVKAAAPDAPSGRRTVLVAVLKVDSRPGYSQYGRHVPDRIVMQARADEGWTCWGTVPASCLLIVEADGVHRGLRPGDRIELTATFNPADNDPKHAFYQRPSGRVVGLSVVVEVPQE